MNIITKWLIMILLIAALITGTATYMNIKVNDTSEFIYAHIDRLNEYILVNKWDKAWDEFAVIKKSWEKEKKIWLLTTDSDKLDEISSSLVKLKLYIELNEYAYALGELVFLRQLLDNVVNGMKFNIINVL